MLYIRCDSYSCIYNDRGYCELGGSQFADLIIEDGECKSFETDEELDDVGYENR